MVGCHQVWEVEGLEDKEDSVEVGMGLFIGEADVGYAKREARSHQIY